MTSTPSPTSSAKLGPTGKGTSGTSKWAPFTLRRRGAGVQIQVYWLRFTVWSAAGLLAIWFSLASSAYFWVKYTRGFTEVKFADMLMLPARWDEYQKSRGDFLIREAEKQIKDGQYREAFHALRTGLQRSPSNKDGRRQLAQFYVAWKQPALAREVLLTGIPYHKDDPNYLRLVFAFLLTTQDDKRVIALKREILGDDQSRTPRNQLIALASATALYYRGNYDESEAVIARYGLAETREGKLLGARLAWDRGSKEQALDILRELAVEDPMDEEVYSQTITYLRELNRNEEARRESLVRVIADPNNARARIDRLYAHHELKDPEAERTAIEEIFHDFDADENALFALGDFAANTGNPQLALRVYESAKRNNLNWESPALMAVEAHVVARDYKSALAMVRQLQKENPEWTKRFSSVFNGLQAIAHYGLGDVEAAQLFVNNYLAQTNIRAENLIIVSKRLLAVGAKTQARQVLDQAVQADPLNQPALTNLIKLDLDLNNTAPLPGNVRKLLAMRRPSRDLLQTVYLKFGSDLFLFSPERTALLQDLRTVLADGPSIGS